MARPRAVAKSGRFSFQATERERVGVVGEQYGEQGREGSDLVFSTGKGSQHGAEDNLIRKLKQ